MRAKADISSSPISTTHTKPPTFITYNCKMPLKISRIYLGSFFSPVKEEQNFAIWKVQQTPSVIISTGLLQSLIVRMSLSWYQRISLIVPPAYQRLSTYRVIQWAIFYIWSWNKASLKIMKWSMAPTSLQKILHLNVKLLILYTSEIDLTFIHLSNMRIQQSLHS